MWRGNRDVEIDKEIYKCNSDITLLENIEPLDELPEAIAECRHEESKTYPHSASHSIR